MQANNIPASDIDADIDLAYRCASGEKQAWDEFVEAYAGLVRSAAAKTIGRYRMVSAEELDDVTSEIFAAFVWNDCKVLRDFKGTCKLSTYLFLVARSRTINWLRKQRGRTISLEDASAQVAQVESPREPAQENPLSELMEAGMQKLSDRDRLVLNLFYRDERSHKEIADLLNTTITNVGSIVSRARTRLKAIIDDLRGTD
ncbi:MAG: sigma-70 family RNA polymerase sigma factor [Planctomycetes bacterium]|nr:sigma-70 family RNA polymerase sigma factor [Planctomycetota bacterium]